MSDIYWKPARRRTSFGKLCRVVVVASNMAMAAWFLTLLGQETLQILQYGFRVDNTQITRCILTWIIVATLTAAIDLATRGYTIYLPAKDA